MIAASRLLKISIQTSILTLMADGMDQAKFKLPRVKDRKSKMWAKLFRPMLHLAACYLHGFTLDFFVSPADLKKDSETQIEMLSLTLEKVFDTHGSLPLGFSLHQDNTYREGKNQYACAWICLLVVLHVFRYTLSSFLKPGHSHEDLDQVFGQTGSEIARHEFETEDDVADILDCAVEQQSEPSRIQRASAPPNGIFKRQATAQVLHQVAPWKDRSSYSAKGLRAPGF
jgi:hypothetical protein